MDRLHRIETITKIVSLVAIPVLLAMFGWLIQSELSEKSLRKEYVQLAVNILSNQSKLPEQEPLREWAIELLAKNAPLPLSPSALKELRTGTPLNPKIVKILVPIRCGPPKIDIPHFPFEDAKSSDDLYTKTKLLLADRLIRQAYIAELESVLIACRGSLNFNGIENEP